MTEKILDLLLQSQGLGYRPMLLALLASCCAGVFIFVVYRFAAKPAFFVRSFGVALAGVTVITTSIILAMQASLVVSLGMVGALSIVRFRTAIKDPLDLVFLFWAVGCGIICGAQLYGLVCIVCPVVTALLFLLEKAPLRKAPLLLVLNGTDLSVEEPALALVKQQAGSYRVRSRNVTTRGIDLIVELRTSKEKEHALLTAVSALEGVTAASLMSHDGDVRG